MALFALARPLQVRYDEYIRLGFQPYMSTLNAGALTFTEFAMQESLPLATIHNAVLEFLRDRDDAVLFGAQAVNAYVHESRMTQDVDILATHAPELAETLRNFLSQRFHIAVRVREIGEGRGKRMPESGAGR